MTNAQKADAFLGLLVALLLLPATLADDPLNEWAAFGIACVGAGGVLWLRRHLERPWFETYTITFFGSAAIMLVHWLFLS
jgi:hypothetical protein